MTLLTNVLIVEQPSSQVVRIGTILFYLVRKFYIDLEIGKMFIFAVSKQSLCIKIYQLWTKKKAM